MSLGRIRTLINNAASAGRRIARDEEGGVKRYHTDGSVYGPVHSAEFVLRGLRIKRGAQNVYKRRLALAARILDRSNPWAHNKNEFVL